MPTNFEDIDKIAVKANRWDYISYAVALYAAWVGPTAILVYPPWFLSMTASTLCLGLVIFIGEAADHAESLRREELGLPPRSGLLDVSTKHMTIPRQVFHLLLIPFVLFIPVGLVLFYMTNILVFNFGLVLGLDLFPTVVKVVYITALLLVVLPIYFFILNRRFNRKMVDWEQSTSQITYPQR